MATTSLNMKDPLVKEFIQNSAGDGAFEVIESLTKGKTDEQIARKTKLKVNDIRAHLNKLHYLGIIHYTKEKAKESNWYTYTWFVKKDRITELMSDRYKEELKKMEEKLGFEQTYTFFKCKNGCNKQPFELAFEYDFKCPECGKMMESSDNEKERKKIERKIKQIKKFLEIE